MAESEELKSHLMKVKEETEKVGLKHSIQKTKIMASSSITSWQIDRETMETVSDFIFWGSKITADGDCSHEIKRRFLVAQLVKNLPAMQETWVRSLSWEDPWRTERLPTPVFWPGEFRGLVHGSQRVGHD